MWPRTWGDKKVCTCGCHNRDNGIQQQNQFTIGKPVGFTDAYHKLHGHASNRAELYFHDWVVADGTNKDGILVVQRSGMPCTKFSIHWNWVYFK